ncbi:MAG TPA: hypothetical protein VGG97_18010 [Bryobacteraceae bacterium]
MTTHASNERARLSQPLQRLAIYTACVVILTSSFDIFLVIEAGGNYRLCQVVVPILLALAVLRARQAGEIPTLGATPLCFWLLFQILFIPATNFWPKSLGYCLWLMLDFALLFSFVQLFSDHFPTLKTILRCYVISFALIAVFGIAQLILPLLGLGGPLVTQWWIQDSLARANGFSYEPSYFATYLIIGFVFVGALRHAHSPLLSSRLLSVIYWIIAAGIFASSSRMGIIFFFVDIFLYNLRPWRILFKDLAKLSVTPATLKALAPSIVYLCFALLLARSTATVLEENPEIALRFLNGTGLADTAAHSVVERADSLEDTVTVFLQHPFVGRSLGGMSSAIAETRGETIHSFEDAKTVEGMSVFAEALAASGVIGIIPFVWFLVATIRKPWILARTASPFYSSLLRAFVRSLIFAWAILQFNQNVLRPYLWTHLAILATVYAAALKGVQHEQQIGT